MAMPPLPVRVGDTAELAVEQTVVSASYQYATGHELADELAGRPI